MKEITAGIEALRQDTAQFIDRETELDIKQQNVLLGKLKTQIYMWRGTKAANSISMGDKIKAELRNEERVSRELVDYYWIETIPASFGAAFMGSILGMVVLAIVLNLGVGHISEEVGVIFVKAGALIGFLLLPVGLSVLKFLRMCSVFIHKKEIKDHEQLLPSYLIKLNDDPVFFLTEVQEYFQEMSSSFRDRLFGLEAKFKAATIEPREKAKQAIAELTADCAKLEAASDAEIANRESLLKIASRRLEEFKEMVASIDPQEDNVLNMFRIAGIELENLNQKIVGISEERRRYESANEFSFRLEKYGATVEELQEARKERLRDIGFYLANLLKYIRAADKLLGEACDILPSIDVISVEEAGLLSETVDMGENFLPDDNEAREVPVVALEPQALRRRSPGLVRN